MYDGVVNSYIQGKIDRATCRKMLWTMGASETEIYFYLEEADKQRANTGSHRTAGTRSPVKWDAYKKLFGGNDDPTAAGKA
jgi:hypothetical protein